MMFIISILVHKKLTNITTNAGIGLIYMEKFIYWPWEDDRTLLNM